MSLDPARVRAVLFDLDGTLVDTDDQYIQRVARLIRPLHFLFPRRDPAAFLRWGLMTAESPLSTLMGVPDWLGFDAPLIALLNWLTDLRARPKTPHFMPMPGAREVLEGLAAGWPLAVITARSARTTQAMLGALDLERYFGAVVSAQTAPHTKPYPDPVLWAARALGVPPAECVMVGDTTVDIRAGRRAGTQTIGLLCGFGQRPELERHGADLILNHIVDLPQALGIDRK